MSDEYILQHPRKQLFYRVLAILTHLTSVGDQGWWGYKVPDYKIIKFIFIFHRYCISICSPIILMSQICYMYMYIGKMAFNARGILLVILPVTVYENAIMISSRQPSFKKAMEDYMGKIHLYNYIGQNDYVEQILVKTEKTAHRACGSMVLILMLDWFAWVTITCYNNYKNRNLVFNKTFQLETIIYMVYPFDYDYSFRNWAIVHLINAHIVWIGCVLILAHMCTNFLFVFQLIGHIKILQLRLKFDFEGDFSDAEVKEKLKDIVKYHNFILNIFEDIQSAFSFNVAAYYLYNLIADSLLLYQVMMSDRANCAGFALMFAAYMCGLIMMSFVLEEIRRQSDDLPDLVYDLPWETMSIPNKKIVLLLLMRIQPVLVFKATGGMEAGVRPMISIIKSTFSYYVMLKSSMNT